MNQLAQTGLAATPIDARISWADEMVRKAVFSSLRGLQGGNLNVVDGSVERSFGQGREPLSATIFVHDARFYRAVAIGGSIGAGESFGKGYWSSDNLTALIQIFSRNMEAASKLGNSVNAFLDFGRKFTHKLRRNTRRGSRRNIAAHYDLSNEFYSLFLDETMTYSSGVFARPDSSMREASDEKYDRICRKLRLGPQDHVLEIGTGWGGFALHAATRYGCRVTTTTISRQQHDFAHKRFAEHGVADRVELLCKDYRDLTGQYDKLVSIEMIEAVGHEYFDRFFGKCSDLLKPDGLFAMQAITIPDQRYERYLRSVDFIQKHIFPGGCLPSLGAISRSIGKSSDLQLVHLEDFAEHYGQTLACWRDRFLENLDRIRDLGMDDHFLRMWEYYLCYCEGAFREKQIGVSQLLFQKPDNRRAPRFPGLGSREFSPDSDRCNSK